MWKRYFFAYDGVLLLRALAKALSVAMNRSIIGATILAGSGGGLAALPADSFGISHKIAMYGGRKFDGQLHRFVILDRAELELRHRLAS
jgi:hypothetical protein